MKYRFTFEIFGKTMTAEIEAPNEVEARDILFRKIREKVKVVSVEGDTPKYNQKEAAGFVDEMFGKFGMNVKR